MYPGILMIYNLLYLKYLLTNDSTIKKEVLESAFYELQDILNAVSDIPQNLVFDEVLEEIEEDYSHLFDTIGEEVSFANEDVDTIFREIEDSFTEDIRGLDLTIKEFIHNIIIYRTLNLPLPTEEAQPFFTLSKNLSLAYQLLAKEEIEHKDQTKTKRMIIFLE